MPLARYSAPLNNCCLNAVARHIAQAAVALPLAAIAYLHAAQALIPVDGKDVRHAEYVAGWQSIEWGVVISHVVAKALHRPIGIVQAQSQVEGVAFRKVGCVGQINIRFTLP
jgi:hypothetical protein